MVVKPNPHRVLIIACGALARELKTITQGQNLQHLTVECLPAKLHNRPEQIPDAVRKRVRAARQRDYFDKIMVGYMDCGTGGLLDRVCAEEEVERLPGAHCYQLFAGADRFEAWQEAEPGTFYLTDYMVRHFDRLIMDGLGIKAHRELRDLYFGNYTRVIYLAQQDDPHLTSKAEKAAAQLGLPVERVFTGYSGLSSSTIELSARPAMSVSGSTRATDNQPPTDSTRITDNQPQATCTLVTDNQPLAANTLAADHQRRLVSTP